MPKVYVLDTNVILHDSASIFKFKEHIVVIPQPVLNELDGKKKEQGEIGYNARQFSRFVDELRSKGSLITGVPVNEEGGKFFISLFDQTVANCLPYQDMSVMDNRILACANHAKTFRPFGVGVTDVILVSKDTNVRILADVFGITAEDYRNSKIQSDELYSGMSFVDVDQDIIDRVYTQQKLDVTDLALDPYPNECFVLRSLANTKQSALVRYNGVMKEYKLLPQDMKTVDVLPKNAEQQFALDILKDESINLVTLTAKAGCGKTFIALAAGLHGVLETQKYQKILLLKPIVPMDNSHELGFLPGGLDEKLGPWMASYADNIEQIMSAYVKDDMDGGTKRQRKVAKKEEAVRMEKDQGKINPVQELIAHGFLEFGSLEHARGRNWSNTFVIIDEAQNTSKNTMKTILTRIGEGSKIVIMGDPSQIDSPWLDSKSNGLTIIQNLMQPYDITAHITLTKSERSKLAELASDVL